MKTKAKKKTSLRGQTIVLFSLTVLAIALMVLMTLSLGAKVRDRMDLQTVADASSYSDAIITARTMNSISVMNRAMIAHTVSTIGTVSLISYATMMYLDAEAALKLYELQLAIIIAGVIIWGIVCAVCWGTCVACFWMKACIKSILLPLPAVILMAVFVAKVKNQLDKDAQLYAQDTAPRFVASTMLFNQAKTAFDTTLRPRVTNPASQFATGYLSSAQVKNSSSLGALVAPINNQELDTGVVPNYQHSGAQPYHAAMIAMGTRGHPFIPQHSPGWFDWLWKLSVPWSLPNVTTVDANSTGRGYLNPTWTNNPNSATAYGHPGSAGASGIYAHDSKEHVRTWMIGLLIAGIGAASSADLVSCNTFGPLAEIIGVIGRSAGPAQVNFNTHNGIHGNLHSDPTQTFPAFYEVKPESLTDRDDLEGQPRLLNLVSKDMSGPSADPWDVRGGARSVASNLTFQFSRSGSGSTFDMVAEPASHTGSKQLAIGAGVAYYSRPDRYPEPPNLFAPFWHATLGRMTIDRPAAGSAARAAYDTGVKTMLTGTGQTEAATAYDQLTTAGFKGVDP